MPKVLEKCVVINQHVDKFSTNKACRQQGHILQQRRAFYGAGGTPLLIIITDRRFTTWLFTEHSFTDDECYHLTPTPALKQHTSSVSKRLTKQKVPRVRPRHSFRECQAFFPVGVGWGRRAQTLLQGQGRGETRTRTYIHEQNGAA